MSSIVAECLNRIRSSRNPVTTEAAKRRLIFELKKTLDPTIKTTAPALEPVVIGLTGLAGSGKDTVAQMLKAHDFKRMAFADELKKEVAAAFELDPFWLNEREAKEQRASRFAISNCAEIAFVVRMQELGYDIAAPRAPRELMQLWGTEYRRARRPDYWVAKLAADLQIVARLGKIRVVVTDVRFPNEATMLRKQLGAQLWRVHRWSSLAHKDVTSTSHHVSETEMSSLSADHDIHNDGSLDQLDAEVIRVLGLAFPSIAAAGQT
jgi:hypothetical protein